jgi:hypothetical protein
LLSDVLKSPVRRARVRKPVGQQECRILGEIAVVGHQQEFAAVDVAVQTLDRMRDPERKVPQVSFADVVREGPAHFVDRGDAGLAPWSEAGG